MRLRLLSVVASHAGGEACVCDLSVGIELTQPTISHHLKILRTAGLLDSERRGSWVYYRVVADALQQLSVLLGTDTLRRAGPVNRPSRCPDDCSPSSPAPPCWSPWSSGPVLPHSDFHPDDVGLQLLENSTATVFGLAVLILVFGPVSGAHFNPVVSAADWLLGRRAGTGISVSHVASYTVAQITGGVVGAVLAAQSPARYAPPPNSPPAGGRPDATHLYACQQVAKRNRRDPPRINPRRRRTAQAK